jgi:hypothetical protein
MKDLDEVKSQWPKAWKNQYNQVVRKRKQSAKTKAQKDYLLEKRIFPQIWNFQDDEESVLSFIAYNFFIQDVISKLLKKFISPEKKDNFRLSGEYLGHVDKICPGYYSHRERIVVILNRFNDVKYIDELSYWVEFQSSEQDHPLTDLVLGMLYLNAYLNNLDHEILLHKSILHLSKAEPVIKKEASKNALKAVLAFSYYMSRDFDKSVSYLGKWRGFEEDFQKLIKNSA